MENTLLTIKQKLSSLSDAEKKVGKYILENPDEIIQLNSNQLSKLSGVSPATIVRFSKSINNSGFPKLKIDISTSMDKDEELIIQEIDPKDGVDSIKKKIGARIGHTIQQSSEILEDKEIEKAVNLINKNNFIISYGVSASGLVAQDFKQKFIRLGKVVIQSYDTHELSTAISSHKENALLVLISNSGSSLECKNLLRLANDSHIDTLVISHSPQSYIANNCDVFLEYSAGQEKETLRTAATTSLIAQMYTMDLIYYRFFCLDYKKNIELIKKSSNNIKKYLGEN